MGLKKVVKKGLFSGFNVKRWVGTDQIKRSGGAIKEIYDSVYGEKEQKKATKKRQETFEECAKRLGLTEKGIQKKMKTLYWLSIACLLGGFVMSGYTIYLLMMHKFLSGFVSFMLSLMIFAYAYRENVYYFQIKNRRLGCSFQQWFNGTFKRSK